MVKHYRLKKGWSQEKLATMTGVSVRTIQRIENGQPPSLETLSSLASVLGVEVSDLQSSAPLEGGEIALPARRSSPVEELSTEDEKAREKALAIYLFALAGLLCGLFSIDTLAIFGGLLLLTAAVWAKSKRKSISDSLFTSHFVHIEITCWWALGACLVGLPLLLVLLGIVGMSSSAMIGLLLMPALMLVYMWTGCRLGHGLYRLLNYRPFDG